MTNETTWEYAAALMVLIGGAVFCYTMMTVGELLIRTAGR